MIRPKAEVEKDLAEIVNIARESWGNEVTVAVRAVTSWFVPHGDGESYESRLNSRVYCRFNPVPEGRHSRTLRMLEIYIGMPSNLMRVGSPRQTSATQPVAPVA